MVCFLDLLAGVYQNKKKHIILKILLLTLPKTTSIDIVKFYMLRFLENYKLPFLRSSMNSSSKMPSSPRKGSCLFRALPGKGGTTI